MNQGWKYWSFTFGLNVRVAGAWTMLQRLGHQTGLAETCGFGVFHVSLLRLFVLTSKLVRVDGIMHVVTRIDAPAVPATWPNSNPLLWRNSVAVNPRHEHKDAFFRRQKPCAGYQQHQQQNHGHHEDSSYRFCFGRGCVLYIVLCVPSWLSMFVCLCLSVCVCVCSVCVCVCVCVCSVYVCLTCEHVFSS